MFQCVHMRMRSCLQLSRMKQQTFRWSRDRALVGFDSMSILPSPALFQAWFWFSIGPSLTPRLSRRNATTDASSWRKRCERCVFCILDKSQCFLSGLWKRTLSNVSCYGEREVFRVLICNQLSLSDVLPAIPLCSLSRCGRRLAKMEQHPLQKDWGTFFLASYTIIADCRSRLTSVYLLLP